jgi:hypothetical protein
MTRCVGKAWQQFSITRQEVVVQSFRKLGLSLPIDGSCDAELSIKGLDPEVLRSGLKEWRTRGCHQEQDEYSESSDSQGEDLGHLMESLLFSRCLAPYGHSLLVFQMIPEYWESR